MSDNNLKSIDELRHISIGRAYEAALFAGRMEEVGSYFTDDIVYWVAGSPPLGGEWRGRDAVLDSMTNREQGLGAADWGSEEISREWHAAADRVIVEIREKSWLLSAPGDFMDQRTCAVLCFRDDKICEMRDYTDSHIYEEFLKRHRGQLPKFNTNK